MERLVSRSILNIKVMKRFLRLIFVFLLSTYCLPTAAQEKTSLFERPIFDVLKIDFGLNYSLFDASKGESIDFILNTNIHYYFTSKWSIIAGGNNFLLLNQSDYNALNAYNIGLGYYDQAFLNSEVALYVGAVEASEDFKRESFYTDLRVKYFLGQKNRHSYFTTGLLYLSQPSQAYIYLGIGARFF